MTILRVICTAFLAVVIATSATSQSLDTQISRLINSGRYVEAELLLEANNPDASDKLFFLGRVLKSRGQFTQAIAFFQKALELNPDHINARRELTHTLILQGQFDQAERSLKYLFQNDDAPAMQSVYGNFQSVINRNKPAGLSASLAFVPSSNVNRGSSKSEFQDNFGTGIISEDNRQKSGFGLQVGLHGFLRTPLSNGPRLTFAGDLWATKYSVSDYDNLYAKISATFESTHDNWRWSLGAYARQKWSMYEEGNIGGESQQLTRSFTATGLDINLQARFDENKSFQIGVLTEDRAYPLASYQDGTYHQLGLHYSQNIDADLLLAGGVTVARSLPALSHLRYDSVELNGSIRKIWNNKIDTSLALSVGERQFHGNYLFRNEPRNDDFWKVGLEIHNPTWSFKGAIPKIGCSYTRNASNIEFFNYDVTECQVAFKKTF